MAVRQLSAVATRWIGTSGDPFPVNVPAGSTVYFVDTDTTWTFDGLTWINEPALAGGGGGGGAPAAGDGAILDGASSAVRATVKNYNNSRALAVITVDTNGDPTVAGGGGVQYTEDAPAAVDPTGTVPILVRADTLQPVTTANGDNLAARGTNKGEQYVKHADPLVVQDGGGSLTVDGGVSIIGTVPVSGPIVVQDGGGSLTVDGSVSVTGTSTVTGTVTANLGSLNGAATDSQLQTSAGTPADAEATGNGSIIAVLKRLRTLLAGGLPTALVGGRLDVNLGTWLGSPAPTVGQKSAASSLPVVLASDQPAHAVTDGGGSLTVDGTVAVSGSVPVTDNAGSLTTDSVDGAHATLGTTSDPEALSGNGTAIGLLKRLRTLLAGGLPSALVGGRLDTNAGAWLGSTAPSIGQKTMANSIPVVIALDQSSIPVTGGAGGGGDGAIVDGDSASIKATVKDYPNSNPLAVITVDTNGDPTVAGGGGVQYQEDLPAAADPTGTALILVRNDSPAGIVSADGDNIAARGTNRGELYVRQLDPVPVTDNGGSLTVDGSVTVTNPATEYLHGTVVATPTGGALLHRDSTNTMQSTGHVSPLPIMPYNGVAAVSNTNPLSVAAWGAATQRPLTLSALDATALISYANGGALGTLGWSIEAGLVGTVIFEGTNAGHFFPLMVRLRDGTLVSSVSSFPAAGQVDAAGCNSVRMRVSAYVSGSCDITWLNTPLVSLVNLGSPLPAGSNQIGNVGIVGTVPVSDGGGSLTIDGSVSISGTTTVSGTVTANLGTLNGAATDAQLQTGVGNQADAETTGSGSVIAVLKRLRTLLAGGLPSALVGGRLDVNNGAWLGSTAPTVGQKTMANSLPVAIALDQAAVSFKTATGDEVAVVRTTLDPLDGAGATVPIKFARVNATADGDNTIIAAVAGKKLRVLGYALVATAAGTISVQDSAGSPAILAQFPLAANGGVSYGGGFDAPAFETPVGNGLEINNPAGVDTLGHLTYVEV
jgi:hypothetical protein